MPDATTTSLRLLLKVQREEVKERRESIRVNDGLAGSFVPVVARVDKRDADGLGAFENDA